MKHLVCGARKECVDLVIQDAGENFFIHLNGIWIFHTNPYMYVVFLFLYLTCWSNWESVSCQMRSLSPSPAVQQVKPRKASPAPSGATSVGNTSSYGSSMPRFALFHCFMIIEFEAVVYYPSIPYFLISTGLFHAKQNKHLAKRVV